MRAQFFPALLFPDIKGENILDLGSGFGSLTMELAKNNSDECRSSWCAECGFRTGSAYTLPFEDYSINVTTCYFMLHHLEDVKFALFKIKRVLKKDDH
ncbi:class I SAM-dependent methyltransferase [Methanosarcina acetivorans]|uniref:class I SAM-dependent methyltransferase n=1 Tax=Methanosarcina acetivorans TaxID=2214 RepID=UPI001D03B9E4|nr:methyltransferase domain-containing protein [Methanosarcina acetivorans]